MSLITVNQDDIHGRYNISKLSEFYKDFKGGIDDLLKITPEGFLIWRYIGNLQNINICLQDDNKNLEYVVCFKKINDSYHIRYASLFRRVKELSIEEII
jgi:hypothetical protein